MGVSLTERVRGLVYKVAGVSNACGTFMIFGLVGVLNVDAVARGVFHTPLKGTVELVIFALVLIVFLQLPDVVRTNRLTRSDGFLTMMRGRHPKFAEFVARVIDTLSCIFAGLITYAVWPEFTDTFSSCSFFAQPEFGPPPTGDFWVDLKDGWARCEYFGTPGVFTAPKWPLPLATFFGVMLCTVIFGLKALLGHRELELTEIEKSAES